MGEWSVSHSAKQREQVKGEENSFSSRLGGSGLQHKRTRTHRYQQKQKQKHTHTGTTRHMNVCTNMCKEKREREREKEREREREKAETQKQRERTRFRERERHTHTHTEKKEPLTRLPVELLRDSAGFANWQRSCHSWTENTLRTLEFLQTRSRDESKHAKKN